ncbi:hypothetical protein ACJMK2_028122 [Sinanodonta woodiana]|uniref:Uncharacterized protein n=1 Tax=Sinanodonta woodiana TaxID=1069815 RepID=A0ABD3X9M7_SINWO
MARSSTTTGNPELQQSSISLQDAVAYMIPNPITFITNEHHVAGSLPQSEWNNDSRRDETQRRFSRQGEQRQGENDTDEQQLSRRIDTLGQQPSESSNTEYQHSPLGQERIRNELAENEIRAVVANDLESDSIENLSNSGDVASLPSCNNFMVDSFCLPAGSRIKSPQYQTFSNRLGTFKNWPSHLTQTPRELALAGFFSLGKADVVRCFSCDGGLKNWEPEDDPWIEHARWFPNCDYLRHVKGDEFIQLVRLMDDESEAEDEQPPVNDDEQTTRYMQALSLDDNQADPCVLDADGAQSVIQTGFSDMTVAKAINDLLKEGKKEFGSQDILTVILDKMEEESVPTQARQSLSTTSRRTNTSRNETVAAMSISKENENLKRNMMCTECGEHERNVLFLPCKHHTVCENCSPHIYVCFICFRRIKEKVKTYMS